METILCEIESLTSYLLDSEKWPLNEDTPKYFKDNETYVLNAIDIDSRRAEFMSDALKSNKKFALTALSKNGLVLQYLDPCLLWDEEVVMAALLNNVEAVEYAKVFNKEMALELLKIGDVHSVMQPIIKLKKQYDKESDVEDGPVCKKRILELFDDKEFIMHIVALDSTFIQYASNKLCHDKDVIEAVAKNAIEALEYTMLQYV